MFVKPVVYRNIICKDATNIIVEGKNKCAVGSVAASIQNVWPPEPYNRKGIYYFGEVIAKKEGKRVITSSNTAGGASIKCTKN